jgi:hypothetical protein
MIVNDELEERMWKEAASYNILSQNFFGKPRKIQSEYQITGSRFVEIASLLNGI